MPRSNWKGSISFGLVSIPIVLYNTENTQEKSTFHQIDTRNNARIKYQRVNVETGKEVPWEDIGKAYEYNKETILPVEEGELQKVTGENSRTIAIEEFVNAESIDFINVQKTYYLLPDKKGDKGYVILREALKKSKKIGIAKVIISTKEYLAAVSFYKNALVLYLLRYEEQIKPLEDFDFPEESIKKYKVTEKEIDVALQLVKSMSGKWKPEKYKDEYQVAVHKWAESKVKHKGIVQMPQRSGATETGKVTNFVDLLRKSLDGNKKSRQTEKSSRGSVAHTRKKSHHGKRASLH